jgi:hypothetical protein
MLYIDAWASWNLVELSYFRLAENTRLQRFKIG